MLSRAGASRSARAVRGTVVISLIVGASAFSSTAGADHGDAAAKQAAAEILAAQDRANVAAQAMFDAESRIEELAIEIAVAQTDLAAIEAESGEMRVSLEQAAVRRFVNASGSAIPLLSDVDSINDQNEANVIFSAASGSTAVELDDFDAVADELVDARAVLEARQQDARDAEADFARLKVAAEAELVRLQEVEAQRLIDDAVEHELQRQRRERQEREEQEAAAAAAAAAARSALPLSTCGNRAVSTSGELSNSSTGCSRLATSSSTAFS